MDITSSLMRAQEIIETQLLNDPHREIIQPESFAYSMAVMLTEYLE